MTGVNLRVRTVGSRRILAMTGIILGFLTMPTLGWAQESSPSAGYDSGFFIRSEDGDHELRVNGLYQIRYIHNNRSEPATSGAEENLDRGGVQLRRTQVDLRGHAFGPRWNYRLRLDVGNGGGVSAAWSWVEYRFPGGLGLRVGQFKPGFMREENVGSTSQLAVERSYLNDYFTTDFSQGLQISKRVTERLGLVGTLHTGSYAYRTDFNQGGAEIAIAGRAEYLIVSDEPERGPGQFTDFSAWSDAPSGVLLGFAADYEVGESGGPGHHPDVFKWTVDLSGRHDGLAAFLAVVGQRYRVRAPFAVGVPAALDGANQIGLQGQLAYFTGSDRWQPYARVEHLRFDGAYFRFDQGAVQAGSRSLSGADDLTIMTLGANHYVMRHNAKLTLDLVYAFDPIPVGNAGSGLLRSVGGDQWTLRSQLQLHF